MSHFIANLSIIFSFLSIAAFGCWDLGLVDVPIFYQIGQFLAYYWFHDSGTPGFPHLEKHALDGPPLVAVTGTGGGARPWPYSANTGYNSSFQTTTTYWDDTIKDAEAYTPVDGMYGVTADKEKADPVTGTAVYYPNAISPNDYIAKRLLGPQANWSQLVNMGQSEIYNTTNFSADPFQVAKMVGVTPDDPRWAEVARFASNSVPGRKFLPPLTSTGQQVTQWGFQNPFNNYLSESKRDYSGGEYNRNDPNYTKSRESVIVEDGGYQIRPDWYQQTTNATALSGVQPDIAVWSGESRNNPTGIVVDSSLNNTNWTFPTFSDPVFNGYKANAGSAGYNYGWGCTVPDEDNSGVWADGLTPVKIQKDYIDSQLTGEKFSMIDQ